MQNNLVGAIKVIYEFGLRLMFESLWNVKRKSCSLLQNLPMPDFNTKGYPCSIFVCGCHGHNDNFCHVWLAAGERTWS